MNIGLDLGYWATKAVAGERRISFPSLVGTLDRGRFAFSENGAGIVLVEPARVQVGEDAVRQSRFVHRREDRSWIESEEYYHLALAALTELTTATVVELRVVTGLPELWSWA